MAIKEFLNAVDLNRETIDTYFALGGLFRSNGEIEKAISIHRSLIARDNINEATRLRALKELAIDFDSGGFVNKAIETYRDVLKINRDQFEVIESLCNIYENIEDWDSAYNYRIMLSKVGHENQSETISHILVQKAKLHFSKGLFAECWEDLEDAFRFAPSVSAKILKLQLLIVQNKLEDAKGFLEELMREHPIYASFIFVSLKDFRGSDIVKVEYEKKLDLLNEYFLGIHDQEFSSQPSIMLTKVRLLKEQARTQEAYSILKGWMESNSGMNEVLKAEYIKLLIDMEEESEALVQTKEFLGSIHRTMTRHYCSQCGYNSDAIFWRCPQCHKWETIQFRWKV